MDSARKKEAQNTVKTQKQETNAEQGWGNKTQKRLWLPRDVAGCRQQRGGEVGVRPQGGEDARVYWRERQGSEEFGGAKGPERVSLEVASEEGSG